MNTIADSCGCSQWYCRFLKLPLGLESVLVVYDECTLQDAARLLCSQDGCHSQDSAASPPFVGIDVEWPVEMYQPQQKRGASLLQASASASARAPHLS